jgi:seryl-tRNA synthetase
VTDDAQEDRLRRHEAMLEGLAKIWEAHHASHQRLDATIAELRDFNRQQVEMNRQQHEFNADVKTTLARIETLLARMIPQGDNGRDA